MWEKLVLKWNWSNFLSKSQRSKTIHPLRNYTSYQKTIHKSNCYPDKMTWKMGSKPLFGISFIYFWNEQFYKKALFVCKFYSLPKIENYYLKLFPTIVGWFPLTNSKYHLKSNIETNSINFPCISKYQQTTKSLSTMTRTLVFIIH